MGTSAAERIALSIESTADLAAVRAARTELGQTAQAAATANQKAASSALDAAAKQQQAANMSAEGQEKLVASIEQTRQAWAASGGDLEKFKAQLAAAVLSEDDLTGAMFRMKDASEQAPKAYKQVTDATRSVTLAQIEAIKMNEAYGQTTVVTTDKIDKMSPKVRSGANALAILSQEMVTGRGSMAGLAVAGGTLATAMATVSSSAKIAAAASGIGALVVVAGLVLDAFEKADEKTKEWASDLHNLGGLSGAALGNIEASTKARIADIQKQIDDFANRPIDIPLTRFGEKHGTDLLEQLKKYSDFLVQVHGAQVAFDAAQSRAAADRVRQAGLEEKNNTRAIDLEKERLRNQIAINGALTSGDVKNALELQLQSIRNERDAQKQVIAEQFRRVDASNHVVALTEAERANMEKLVSQADQLAGLKERQARADQAALLIQERSKLAAGSDNVFTATGGKLAQIEEERRADLQRLGDVGLATDIAEQKKRALYRETAKVANDNAKTIFDVMRSSQQKSLAAIGTFGENIRRVVIGAEAAHALVKAAKETGEAIASLAIGDFRGAALHGAAAAQFGAAAALGARESLGGGGGGSSGGGGGGGGGTSNPAPYAPNNDGGSNPTVINLYTQNPFSGETMSVVQYELNRNGVLKRPVNLPPTTGLAYAGAR